MSNSVNIVNKPLEVATRVTPNELEKLIGQGEKLQLIDVRSPGEYATGHVPCAVNIPMEQVETRLNDLRPGEHVVLVCQSGRRACITEDLLKAHREDIIVLEGGTTAWANAGLPIVGNAPARWSLERQVRLGAGLLILLGVGLGFAVSPGWFGLAGFVGVGLTFAGITNICGMASLLALMPWNKAKSN